MAPLGARAWTMAFVLAAFTTLPGVATAQLDQSPGGWLTGTFQGNFDFVSPKLDSVRWWFDGQARMRDDGGFDVQGLVRPGVGWAFNDSGTVYAGYAFIRTVAANGAASNEHRAWQDFLWKEPWGRAQRIWRTRLEERWKEGSSDAGVRLRQFFKADWPVREGSRFSLVAFDEFFFFLNDTTWGQSTGFDQNRAFVGFAWRFDEKGRYIAELGYLNQFESKSSGIDKLNHLVMLNLYYK